MRVSWYVWLMPIGLTALALAPLPYGYCIFLRFALSVMTAFLAWAEYRRTESVNGWLVGLVVLAITYNPFKASLFSIARGWILLHRETRHSGRSCLYEIKTTD
jgi:hypothetical protein